MKQIIAILITCAMLAITGCEEAQEDVTMQNVLITAGGETFTLHLYENDTAAAFAERLPLTLSMSELNGNEKYFYMSKSLPAASNRPDGIHAGDLMLYGSDCLVLFYDSFSTSYSYTPIGSMEDATGLAGALGSGSVSVTFELTE